MNTIRTLCLLLCIISLISCKREGDEPQFYTWQTIIEVKYSDNTKDTVINKVELHKSIKPEFYIRTESKGFIDNTKLVPCVVMETRYERENLACDVRTFRILKQNKLP